MTINLALTVTSEEGSITVGKTTVDAASGLTGDEEAAFWEYLWFHFAAVDEATGERVARTPQTRAQTVRTWLRAVRTLEQRKMVNFARGARARAAEATLPDFSGKGAST